MTQIKFVVENNDAKLAEFDTLREAIQFGENHPEKESLYIVEDEGDGFGEICKLSFLLEMKERGELENIFTLWDIW